MISAIVVGVIFIVLGETAIGKGLILGTCFSILNFILMGKSIRLTLGRSRNKAVMAGLFSILCRYAVLAIPLVVAIKSVSFSFVAVVIGIFAVQIMTLVDYLITKPIWEGR